MSIAIHAIQRNILTSAHKADNSPLCPIRQLIDRLQRPLKKKKKAHHPDMYDHLSNGTLTELVNARLAIGNEAEG